MSLPNLVHVSDSDPGIVRIAKGRGFAYRLPSGDFVKSEKEKARIKSIGVPPAYQEVWICSLQNGHLQATGRDDRGRKQYLYHPDWQTYRSVKKFESLPRFGEALPRIRRRVRADLKAEPGSREFTLSALVKLLDHAALRVGTKRYAEENGTYGATTLLPRHMQLDDDRIHLKYTAKGGKRISRSLRSKRLHKILEKISDLPGRQLFVYRAADGSFVPADSSALNDYLTDASGIDAITAKTFRTWSGTLAAFSAAMDAVVDGNTPTIKQMTESASERLYNTPTICRNSYIHPSIIGLANADPDERQRAKKSFEIETAPSGLKMDEARLLNFLTA